jgi:hypothetical protein
MQAERGSQENGEVDGDTFDGRIGCERTRKRRRDFQSAGKLRGRGF